MDLHEILTSIANSADNEDERIALMKDLLVESENYSESDREKIGGVLEGVVADCDDDILARQHAANEIGHYLQSAPASVGIIFRNADEDLDLRYNIQASFPGEFSVKELPTA